MLVGDWEENSEWIVYYGKKIKTRDDIGHVRKTKIIKTCETSTLPKK